MTCNNPRADINRDGVVDFTDFVILGGAFGSKPGDPHWDPDADINQDGVVDDNDLIIFKANYGCKFDGWNPWADGVITDEEMALAKHHWLTGTPIYGHIITDAEISLLEYQWATGDVTVPEIPYKPECKEGDKKPGHVCVAGKWQKVTVAEPVVEPAAKVAAKRLTYKEALVLIDAGLPVYIKFDIPVLDQMPGIRWGLWMPVLPGFVLTTEP